MKEEEAAWWRRAVSRSRKSMWKITEGRAIMSRWNTGQVVSGGWREKPKLRNATVLEVDRGRSYNPKNNYTSRGEIFPLSWKCRDHERMIRKNVTRFFVACRNIPVAGGKEALSGCQSKGREAYGKCCDPKTRRWVPGPEEPTAGGWADQTGGRCSGELPWDQASSSHLGCINDHE